MISLNEGYVILATVVEHRESETNLTTASLSP